MTITTKTGSNNYTIEVWYDAEWGVWLWLSDTDGGIA